MLTAYQDIVCIGKITGSLYRDCNQSLNRSLVVRPTQIMRKLEIQIPKSIYLETLHYITGNGGLRQQIQFRIAKVPHRQTHRHKK